MNIVKYINRINNLYGNESTPKRFDTTQWLASRNQPAAVLPEEFDELSPKEELYYQKPPFSTNEVFLGSKGGVSQLVDHGPSGVRQGYADAGLVTTPVQRNRLRKKFPKIDFDFKKYPNRGVASAGTNYGRVSQYSTTSEFKTGKKADISKIQMELYGTEKDLTKNMKDYLKQRYPRNKNIEKLWIKADPIRRSGWKKNLKTWLVIKDIPGIEKLKGKPGEGGFNAQVELLKEFNKIKPTYKTSSNPKGRLFTVEEWLEAGPQRRKVGRMNESEFLEFREKTAKHVRGFMKSQKEKLSPQEYEKRYGIPKKEAALGKAQKLHPERFQPGRAVLQREDNVLLNYMTRAAKQQAKNLDKNLAEYIDIEKDGKFLGVRDVKTGTNYYHAQYPKSKLKLGDKLITSHPEYEKAKELKKAASKFKYDLPNKTIASYFSDYKRVPNLGELANFLTRAGIKLGDSKELVNQKINLIAKYSDKSMKANPLHLHHMLTAEVEPVRRIQLRLQDRNDMAGKIVEQVKRGNISKADAFKQLKKINVSMKIGETVVGAREDVPVGQQVSAAKRRTTKMFFDALKQRPDLVKIIAKRFGIAGKATAASVAAFMTANAIAPQEALAGETGIVEKAKSWPIEHPWLTGAGATGAAATTKGGRNILGKAFRTLGTPLSGLGWAAYTASDNLKSGKGLTESVVDPWVGMELTFPSMFKENISKITKSPTLQKVLGLGKFGSRFIPGVGIAITLGSLSRDSVIAINKEAKRIDAIEDPDQQAEEQEIFIRNIKGYAGGGLANLTRTVAPDSGPVSRGLRSLYIDDMD